MKRLIVILSSIVLLLTFAPVASAATQGSCFDQDNYKMIGWENNIGDTSDNNDALWICYDQLDLTQIAHTLPGDCHAIIAGHTWNDCLSSATVWIPVGHAICFWDHVGGVNLIGYITGNTTGRFGVRYNLTSGDRASAITFEWPCGG